MFHTEGIAPTFQLSGLDQRQKNGTKKSSSWEPIEKILIYLCMYVYIYIHSVFFKVGYISLDVKLQLQKVWWHCFFTLSEVLLTSGGKYHDFTFLLRCGPWRHKPQWTSTGYGSYPHESTVARWAKSIQITTKKFQLPQFSSKLLVLWRGFTRPWLCYNSSVKEVSDVLDLYEPLATIMHHSCEMFVVVMNRSWQF